MEDRIYDSETKKVFRINLNDQGEIQAESIEEVITGKQEVKKLLMTIHHKKNSKLFKSAHAIERYIKMFEGGRR